MTPVLKIEGLSKEFTLHQQGGTRLAALENVNLDVGAGEAVAITGQSGRGKSTLLKLIYGSYKASGGTVRVLHQGSWVDVAAAQPRDVLRLRQQTIGYVTQFLRVIPRVPAIDIVAEPLIDRDVSPDVAVDRARDLLARLNIPEKLWHLSPMTFSGGEQQRVNIARGFAAHHPILLLDEPTASLDEENRSRVLSLIAEARAAGSAVVAVFHDEEERRKICEREVAL
jgi:alpha-D-ribose 1-methylphosphonate 5-triphosphate synthase subunit PhnL